MQGKWFHFVSRKLHPKQQTQSVPAIGVPCIYLLAESGLRNPIYIGEYGKSEKYNVIGRIEAHFGKNRNLRCVAKNMTAFKLTVPERVTAYVIELDNRFTDQASRRSLEAWVIIIVCNQLRIHDNRFAVTSFSAPTTDYELLAREIVSSYIGACD